ncbi:MAG: hypothetical protein FJ014_10670 [Chloroflexi bacterium]|nr:hypothetical protein [Chloroflexota bacterium]
MTLESVYVGTLAQVIRESGRPMHVNVLARAAVRAQLEAEPGERLYAPGARYAEKETIRFKDQSARVKAVRAGGNPKQGKFKILTLALPDGTERYVAAEVPGAPAEDRQPVTDDQVHRIIEEHGPAIRTAVQEALGTDSHFVWFQDTQGDHWCLAEILPEVRDEELAQVWPLLHGLLVDGIIHPRPTEELVKAIWEQENNGSDAYLLKAFALNVALQRCRETRRLGAGWVLEEEWQELQERPVLVGPREENVIMLPEGVVLDVEEELVDEEEEPKEPEKVMEEDLEAWRRTRRLNATTTLGTSHYYGNWLQLTQDMRRVFPPRAAGADAVTFYHRFGGEEESFQAWVNWERGRILGSPQMYQAFYMHGIYPGAKLVISHRGNLREYDIRTKTTTKQGTVRVRRVFWVTDEADQPILDGEGHPKVEYEETDEPCRYEVSDEVFIAAASWEDLPALFAEADRVGQGYFGLMYEVCCEGWEAKGRKPLYVTADELFQEIHYNRRLVTSTATIPWELWRRSAFEPVGNGKYWFRPEKGERVRSVGPRRRVQVPTVVQRGPQFDKDRSLQEIARSAQVTDTARDLWAALWADDQRKAALQAAVQAYMEDPAREKVLFLRGVAHQRIRELVAKDRLEALTLDEFNRQIWQLGSVKYQGHSHRIDSEETEALLGAMSAEQLKEAYESGELEIEGNQTWGSYSSVIGSRLGKSNTEMEQVVRDTLRVLLYGGGPIERRMEQVIREPNGFGINVVSGILHAVYPEEHILYNSRSVDALHVLGLEWPADWQWNVDTYVAYRDFCKQAQKYLGFRSLTDVDWCAYNLGLNRISFGQTRGYAELDLEAMYMLGLATAKGVFSHQGLRVSLQRSTLETDVAGLDRSAIADSIDLLEDRLATRFRDTIQVERTANVADIVVTQDCELYSIAASLIGNSESLIVPDFVFDLPREHKIEFTRGFADAAGYVRRAQYYTDGRMFIFFQIRQSDWFLPPQICRLFQLELGIPVSFIIWGHPNIRDPHARAPSGSWAKEHQLKVFCDAFEEVGFYLPYKQQAFQELVRINKEIGKRIPDLCHPIKKSIWQTKPVHPEETSGRLPSQLRGVHCDAWWQVCLKMGCPFAEDYPEQETIWNR